MKQPTWQLNGHRAALRLPGFAAQFDCHQPALGLHALGHNDQLLESEGWLRIELASIGDLDSASCEFYVRGDDLIVTYADTPSRPLRSQIYLRSATSLNASTLATVELVASIQTHLLDSHPALAVYSRIAAASVWRLTDAEAATWQRVALQPGQSWAIDRECGVGAFLLRLPGGQSYAEFVHPIDFQHTALTMQEPAGAGWPQIELRHHLFSERLEKGVILRARCLAALLPRENDLETAIHLYRAFSSAQAPLTT